jgi:signal transduction histidine kinase
MATAVDAVLPSARAAGRGSDRFRQEFLRVFNFGTVAIVFYLCLLLAFTRWLPNLYLEDRSTAIDEGIRYLRQTLISGMTALAAIALVQASAEANTWSARRTIVIGAIAVVTAATTSAVLRLLAVHMQLSELAQRWPWALGVIALWSLVGGLGFALAHLARADRAARQRLLDVECARETLGVQMVQARLSALQAQIEPHFLFNTLATVKRLYETVPERGREMLVSLIDYLHAALPSMRGNGSTLKRELELARAYLTILQMRMGERLRFTIDCDSTLADADVPPLVLGTLIENAIKHGLAPLPEGGGISIRAARDGDRLRLEVRDSGRGFSDHAGSGVGLANIRSRLAALYGNGANLTLSANSPRGVIAAIALPLHTTSMAVA